MIDGKRSQDRSWRCVWAEIRGNKLKLTIHREGKSSQVSQSFFFTLFFVCEGFNFINYFVGSIETMFIQCMSDFMYF